MHGGLTYSDMHVVILKSEICEIHVCIHIGPTCRLLNYDILHVNVYSQLSGEPFAVETVSVVNGSLKHELVVL